MIEHMLDFVYFALTALLSFDVLSGQIFAGSPTNRWLILLHGSGFSGGGLLRCVKALMDLDIGFASLDHRIARSLLWSHLSAKWVSSFDYALRSMGSICGDHSRCRPRHGISGGN